MLNRTSDLKRYIVNKYAMPADKFEIVKIGPRIWIYLVTKNNTMGRSLLYTGALNTVDESNVLKSYLNNQIETALKTFEYLT